MLVGLFSLLIWLFLDANGDIILLFFEFVMSDVMSVALSDKIVLITGASSGIGLACAEVLALKNVKLLLCARGEKRLMMAADSLRERFDVEVHAFSLDVSDPIAVEKRLRQLPKQWQAIDILINNAGFALGVDALQEGKLDDWSAMIDTNIKGLLYMTRFVLKTMLKRNQGHIVNIGSISGHGVYAGGVVYCATKHAVRAITDGIKMDVHGTPIRVSAVDPGMVETDFSRVRYAGNQKKAIAVYENMRPLHAKDVAEAVEFCVTRPSHVDVRELVIMPTDQTAIHLLRRGEKN